MREESLEEALSTLGSVLEVRRAPYTLAVVGGGALLLLRLLDRPTRDLDVIAVDSDGRYVRLDVLPAALAGAVATSVMRSASPQTGSTPDLRR